MTTIRSFRSQSGRLLRRALPPKPNGTQRTSTCPFSLLRHQPLEHCRVVTRGEEDKAERLNRAMRWIYPVAAIALLVTALSV